MKMYSSALTEVVRGGELPARWWWWWCEGRAENTATHRALIWRHRVLDGLARKQDS